MKRLIIAGIACMAALTQVNAADAKKEGPTELKKPEASIPFIDMRSSILGWQADGEQGLWIQDSRKEWYYARTFGRCDRLDFAVQIGIKTLTNTLDRNSEIVVPNSATATCALQSFTKSEPPPVEKKKGAK